MFTGTLPFSATSRPYIALAPMEGLMDGTFRELLTAIGGIDHCVTEFIRVTHQVYPEKVFYRFAPELKNGGCTRAGTPVHIQLLGSHPELLARNAAKAAKLGAPAIDLNFGCPAKTVNRSQGGAVLLQYPDLLNQIATEVRKAVPSHIPVSAKMRLGFKDKSLAVENAQALAEGGIQWLTVHARTKLEGYKPPAWWSWINTIRMKVKIPVLANGEIWTPQQAHQCQHESGSDLLMIGRGLVATPDLGLRIKNPDHTPMTLQQNLALLKTLAQSLPDLTDKQLTDRLKQWLHYYSMHSAEMQNVFDRVKKERSREGFFAVLQSPIPF
ncbi:MAG: tRNA dihydrouridine(16) synthase DusC [Oceanospirillaceae bacterium]|nr:tRNA dihydrouridine(16) synthase DusC [Oceanospirillaceae bacterium]